MAADIGDSFDRQVQEALSAAVFLGVIDEFNEGISLQMMQDIQVYIQFVQSLTNDLLVDH
jgi:hypothetical protein